ncbi:MAG: TonB-dependent receptor plug domain-containing protein, partial [Phaeodactylibacter sp.]|nr:TonB-dependent receptor plug domain-containing protein [Phaeodactylibacter sp.]
QFTFSDRDGYYAFAKVSEGNHQVDVSYIGFTNQSTTISVAANSIATANFILEAGVELAEVVVVGQVVGQAKALNQQAANANITNIIAADQVGRFPDANIGDALKRVPGISVQYDQGEARFGSVRGIAPQLNSVTINGERIPSAEAEIRTIQLDLIPSDMIQTIEVNKAVTADMDADAIGSSINLVTRSAPYEQRISGTIGGGYNLLAGKPTYNASLIYGNRFAEDRLGVIVSASIFDNNLGSDNVEAEWTYDDANDNDVFDEGEAFWPEEIQIRQYYLRRLRQSYSASFDYKINPANTLYLKGIFNHRQDWENRYRSIFKDIEEDNGVWYGETEREVKSGTSDINYARLEDQQMMSFSLGGDHLLGGVKLTWSGSYAKASEDRPNERYFEINSDELVPLTVDFSNPRTPYVDATESQFRNPSSAWKFSTITEEFQYTEDVDMNGRVDLQIPISNKKRNFVKVGVRYRGKQKQRENDFYEYAPENDSLFLLDALNNLEDQSKDNFLAGDYVVGSFPTREYVGDLDLANGKFEGEQDPSE